MKELKCRKCKKVIEVEDGYKLRTCEICRTKEKERYRVKSKKLNVELHKKLQITEEDKQKMPKMFWSFSDFTEEYERHFHRKPSYEEYQNRLLEWKKQQIQKESDLEVAKLQSEAKAKIRDAEKWIRFDSYEPSNPKKCKAYRLMQLEAIERDEAYIEEHESECESCKEWNYYREEGYLQTKEQEEEAWDKPQTEEDKIEKMLDRGKDVTLEALEAISEQEHMPKEETTESTLESEEDTQRILRMSEDKLKEWQQQPETEHEPQHTHEQQPSYSQQVLDSLNKLKQKKQQNNP